MRIKAERKQDIVLYLLEKIANGETAVTKVTSLAFGISQNTAHAYIQELLEQGIIRRIKQGKYELVTHSETYQFKRSEGGLDSDTLPYDLCVAPVLSHVQENIRHIWSYVVSEMVNNVMDHSEAEHMHVLVKHNYLITSVLIMDDGVGIFDKIQKHFSLPKMDDAIAELFKGKLTTDETNHSGEGIFFSSKMMDKFLILSGGGVFATTKFSEDIILELQDQIVAGTCVFMELSNFSKKSTKEVFDLYTDCDDGFSKTYIPLKHFFDSAPVSRSQAKRLCSRLERFKEIEIDFEGIDWMGQGFAHQIFVVYQNQYPNTKLVPLHMSEGVKSMYIHVTNTK